jgi:hypothetical protein
MINVLERIKKRAALVQMICYSSNLMDRTRTAAKSTVKTVGIPVLERQTFSGIPVISAFQRQRESTNCNSQLNILSNLIELLCSLYGIYIN